MNGLLTAITICAMVAIMMSAMPSENIMTKDNDTTVINTELLSKNVKGFKGTTPVKIFIVKNKIVKIETLLIMKRLNSLIRRRLYCQNSLGKAFQRLPKWM